MAGHGFYCMSRMTFSHASPFDQQIRSGWMEGWRGGAKGKRRRKAGEPVQCLVEFKCCAEKESWTGATNGQVKGRVLLLISLVLPLKFVLLMFLHSHDPLWVESILSPFR